MSEKVQVDVVTCVRAIADLLSSHMVASVDIVGSKEAIQVVFARIGRIARTRGKVVAFLDYGVIQRKVNELKTAGVGVDEPLLNAIKSGADNAKVLSVVDEKGVWRRPQILVLFDFTEIIAHAKGGDSTDCIQRCTYVLREGHDVCTFSAEFQIRGYVQDADRSRELFGDFVYYIT